MPDPRCILHVDMDAFFASVEQRDFPELKGKPVIIGGKPDQRGVVSAASYEARKFGVHSAMPLREAGRRCPEGIFRPGRMQAYRQASRHIFEIFDRFSPYVQGLSVDEAFLDVTGSLHLWGDDEVKMGEALRAEIFEKCQLTASVGIAGNKFLAKLASDMDKPNGLTVVPREAEEIRTFLAPLDVGRIWGVGKKTKQRLAQQGIRLVGDLQNAGKPQLVKWFGQSSGEHLYALANGLDARPVHDREPEKSISNEHTYTVNQDAREVHHQTLLRLSEKVGRRLRASGYWASCVQIKIRSDQFQTYTRQKQLAVSTRSDQEIFDTVLDLFEKFDPPWPVRLLGVGVSQLSDVPVGGDAQLDLFSPPPQPKERKLDAVVDGLRNKYGVTSVKRGRWDLET
ncbi:DNA polymerase IV [Kiritimatiellaeota bacterium B1221]|nr:DNA polymerase IV [Kiritimatiellaeota bacterium B1221]